MKAPIINYFRIKSITIGSMVLEWDIDNAHTVEIRGLGFMAFDSECKLNRDSKKLYEYTLIAKNLESKLETKAHLEIHPAPLIENFEYEVFKNGKIFLKYEAKEMVVAKLIELNQIIKTSFIFDRKLLLGNTMTLVVDGKNEGETARKSITITQNKLINWKKTVWVLISIISFFFVLSYILYSLQKNNRTKNEMIIKSNDKYQVFCDVEQDTLMFIKQKLADILPALHSIPLQKRKQELACLQSLSSSDTKFILIVSSESGNNFHKLDNYIEKPNIASINVDSFDISQKLGRINKVRIYAKFLETADESLIVAAKIDHKYKNSIEKIPTLFQGKYIGRVRRIKIEKQLVNGSILVFEYSILGIASEQHKKGKMNWEKHELELETMGKGTFIQAGNYFIWQLPDGNIKFESIN